MRALKAAGMVLIVVQVAAFVTVLIVLGLGRSEDASVCEDTRSLCARTAELCYDHCKQACTPGDTP